jgi:arylsulfatase A-like enzyme
MEIPTPATFDDDYATRRIAAAAEDMRFDLSLEPDYAKEIPKGLDRAAKKRWIYQRFVKDYYGAIAGIDDNLGRVLDHLRKTGQYDNTLVIYTTDNGFFVGDHGWYDKRFMYEPSLRIPLIVKPPSATGPGRVTADFALNIDYASTILDYAGCTIPETMQGRSLRPVLEGSTPADWRTSMYYAYYENSWVLAGKGKEAMSDPSFAFFTPHRIGPHRGVRTRTHKLIHYYSEGEYWELFDLEKDPNELNNLYGEPALGALTGELKGELTRLRRQYGDSA